MTIERSKEVGVIEEKGPRDWEISRNKMENITLCQHCTTSIWKARNHASQNPLLLNFQVRVVQKRNLHEVRKVDMRQ